MDRESIRLRVKYALGNKEFLNFLSNNMQVEGSKNVAPKLREIFGTSPYGAHHPWNCEHSDLGIAMLYREIKKENFQSSRSISKILDNIYSTLWNKERPNSEKKPEGKETRKTPLRRETVVVAKTGKGKPEKKNH